MIVGGIVAAIFLTNDDSSSSIGPSTAYHTRDQSTQTESLLTEYIVVEYV